MSDVPIQINFITIIISIGVFVGLFISYFLIVKSWKSNISNLIMGFFILMISLGLLEGLLNYSRYIFKYLWLTNFSEPANFTFAPLIYLFTLSQFRKVKMTEYLLHLIPFVFWLGYCFFFFAEPDNFKYNSNIETLGIQLPFIPIHEYITDDPLGLRDYINELMALSFVIYIFLSVRILILKSRSIGESLFTTKNKTLRSQRISLYHFSVVIMIFILVKAIFKNDVGDYFIYMYLTFILMMNAVQIVNRSDYFNEVSTFLEGPMVKYRKSSLEEKQKESILNLIEQKMREEKYFVKSTASLSDLANEVGEHSHHVSQVINEKLGLSFFELLAEYRVEEACLILNSDLGKKIIIEEIAERVGYNSKSAFNNAFKKITGKTPSQYRDS